MDTILVSLLASLGGILIGLVLLFFFGEEIFARLDWMAERAYQFREWVRRGLGLDPRR